MVDAHQQLGIANNLIPSHVYVSHHIMQVLGKLTEKFLEEVPDRRSPVHKSDVGANATTETTESKQQDCNASGKKVSKHRGIGWRIVVQT